MDLSEIMVGDWVYDSANECYVEVTYKDFRNDCIRILDDFEPIPLTPEILEKNGFHWGNTASEKDSCGATRCDYPEKGWCFDEGAGEIKIIFPNEDGGLIQLDDQSFDRLFELVFVKPIMLHELQHALRLCGIDKEIVL